MLEFTEKAKRALELSEEISKELHHRYIGSEHLLCGLMREGTGVAARVLKDALLALIRSGCAQASPAEAREPSSPTS